MCVTTDKTSLSLKKDESDDDEDDNRETAASSIAVFYV
jgi:hypothetical protein